MFSASSEHSRHGPGSLRPDSYPAKLLPDNELANIFEWLRTLPPPPP